MRTALLLLLLIPCSARAGVVAMPWTPTPDQDGSQFGAAVAPAGDVDGDGYGDVIVGAPAWSETHQGEGRAFLYRGTASGISNTPVWAWSPGEDFAAAGTAVASAGDLDGDGYAEILVGVPNWDSPSGIDAGAVFVFKGSASGPLAVPFDTLWYGPSDAHFGAAVSWAGDVNGDGKPDVLVGSPNYSNGQVNEGGITVWLGTLPRYPQLPSFALEFNQANGRLGTSVSTAGDVNGDGLTDIIAGAPGSLFSGHPWAGRAVVYAGANSVSGIGALLRAYVGLADSTQLGTSVANAGDVNADGYADILIGAPGGDGFATRAGDVYLYPGSAAGPTASPFFQYHGLVDYARFGNAVGTAGDLDGDGYADVLIGSSFWPDPADSRGEVRLYYGGKDALTFGEEIVSPHLGIGFASALATTGDATGDGYAEFMVGAPGLGTAYAWSGKPAGPVAAANSPLLAIEPGNSFGLSLAVLPHIDNGPFPTLLIGTPTSNSGAGSVNLFPGQWASFALSAVGAFSGTEAGENFGILAADAGDVNRDGYTDFIATSPSWDGSFADHGKATLFLGSDIGPVASSWPGDESLQVGSNFGLALAANGDINGDGYHDVVIGVPNHNSEPGPKCGEVLVYLGGAGGLGFPASWLASGLTPYTYFGSSLAMGDFDSDGYSDVAVGILTSPRSIQVFFGGPSGLTYPAGWNIVPVVPISSMATVGSAGDWNGDGIDDLIACAPLDNDGKGTIAVYAGSRSRTNPLNPLWIYRDASINGLSLVPAGGGDLNGDGYADVVVAAPYSSNGESSEGSVLVFFGRQLASPNVPIQPDLRFESNIPSAYLGRGITLGDLNDDGFTDIIAGAPGADRVYAWFGGGEGVPRHTGFTEYGFGDKWRWSPARLDDETRFNAQQSQRSAGGRDNVAEEYEIQLQGTPFTGVPNRARTNPYQTFAPGPLGSVITGNYAETAPWKATTSRFKRRDVTNSPYFPRSRWMSPGARLSGTYDFRTAGVVTGVVPSEGLRAIRVSPNPVRAAATLEFTLAQAAQGAVDLYDVRGRHVRELARGAFPAGPSTFSFSAEGVPPGLYFAVLRAGPVEQRCRVVRLP